MATWQDRVEALLKQKRIRAYELAKAVGVAHPTMSKWMNGKNKCSLENRMKIAEHLGVSLQYLDNGIQQHFADHETVVFDSHNLIEHLNRLKLLGNSESDHADEDPLKQEIRQRLAAHSLSEQLPDDMQANTGIQPFSHASSQAFMIHINDDTMVNPNHLTTEFYPKNSNVTIDPARKPTSGEAVLIHYEQEVLFRIWMPLGKQKHAFNVVNPLYQADQSLSYEGELEDILIGTAIGYTYSK